MMKTFLAQFTIYDGEHEHDNQFLLYAKNIDQAWIIARKQEHDTDSWSDTNDEANQTYWDYGDSTTRSKLKGVQEISEEDAKVLTRLMVAFYIDKEGEED